MEIYVPPKAKAEQPAPRAPLPPPPDSRKLRPNEVVLNETAAPDAALDAAYQGFYAHAQEQLRMTPDMMSMMMGMPPGMHGMPGMGMPGMPMMGMPGMSPP